MSLLTFPNNITISRPVYDRLISLQFSQARIAEILGVSLAELQKELAQPPRKKKGLAVEASDRSIPLGN